MLNIGHHEMHGERVGLIVVLLAGLVYWPGH